MEMYFVYIITNHTNTVLYTGVTNNLERRLYEHKNKINVSSFSKKYRLYKLLWFEQFDNIKDAIETEKRIKGWKRHRKINLIRGENPQFLDLSSKL